jgi:hypothetical protein
MIKKITGGLILVALSAYLIWTFAPEKEPAPLRLKSTVKASIGSPEDPMARFNYQFMKLRNPQTGQIPDRINQLELEFASRLPVRSDHLRLLKAGGGGSAEVQLSNTWQLRGPYNVGGRTRALGIDVSNENVIISGGVSGGMWRSTDSGQSWMKTTQPQQLHSVTCLVQDTRSGKTNTWYYGTGEYRGNTASGGGNAFFLGDGIFKSTDGGQSWTVLPSTVSNSPQTFNLGFDVVWNVAIDPSNIAQDEVYAATYGRIYRSTNGGSSWSAVLAPSDPNNARYTDIAVSPTGVVFATISSGESASQGIWRSTDGSNWTRITPAGWPGEYRRVVLDIAPSNENIVYFLADTPGSGTSDHQLWKYEYISGDGTGSGGVWSNRSANVPAQGGSTGDFSSQASYNLIIKVKPDNPDVVFIGGINLYRSNNGFANTSQTAWIGGYVKSNDSFAKYPNHHPDQHALVFYPSNYSKVISGHDGGLSVTNDVMAADVTWQYLNNGYYTTQYYTIAIDYTANQDNLLIGGMQDNGTYRVNSGNTTASWEDLLGGDGAFCAISANKAYYYVSVQNGQTYRLKGDNPIYDWARVDPEGGENYLFINPFVLDRNNSAMMFMAGGNVVWRNSNLTAIAKYNTDPTSVNWTKLTNTQIASGSITALEASKNPANRLYYGTSTGKVYRLNDAHSGNPSPLDITSASFPAGAYVSSISANPESADEVALVFSNYGVISVWHSSNGGTTWQNISGNLEQNPDGSGSGPAVHWIEILPVDEATMYLVGTSTGVYSTLQLDGASTQWMQEGPTTIGNVVTHMIDSRPTDNLVVVATHGGGVYSTNVSLSPLPDDIDAVVDGFALAQNYPNPFNPSTTIEYQLARAGEVQLKIFDLQGREVATLLNQFQNEGRYAVTWNSQDRFGRPVGSGTYIYRLTSGSFSESKQMVVLR